MKKQNYLILGIIILIGVGAFLFLNNYNKKEGVTVRIAYLPAVNAQPLALAVEKGYFKQEGIVVEAIKFDAPNQIIDAILQDRIDFIGQAVTAIGAIADSKNPGKMKIFSVSGGTKEVPNEHLLVSVDSKLSSIPELKGKKLGILAGTIQWKTIARDILAKNGLDIDNDLTIVELATGLQVQALASGQIDALLALEPIPTIAINQGVAKIMFSGPAEEFIANPFYPGAGWVSTKFAKENPETTKSVISVLDRAMKEIESDPAGTRKYLKGYTPLTDELIEIVPLNIFRSCEELTADDKKALQDFLDIYTTYKVVDGQVSLENLLFCNN